MYAYARVIIERPNVRALPRNSLDRSGGRSYFWSCVENKAHRSEVQTGVTDGHWVEVIKRRSAADDETSETDAWVPVDGSEQVIVGDLSLLTEGVQVTVSQQDETPKAAGNLTARGAARSGQAPPPVR